MAIKNDDDPLQRMNVEYHLEKQNQAEDLLLPKAVRGNWDAIRNLLSIVADALDDGSPLTPRIAAYLAGALRKITEGKNHKEAFNIRRGRGKRDTRRAIREGFLNAYRVEYYCAQGESLLNAKLKVVEDGHVTEGAVNAQWAKYHKAAKRRIEDQIQRFGNAIPADQLDVVFDKLSLY